MNYLFVAFRVISRPLVDRMMVLLFVLSLGALVGQINLASAQKAGATRTPDLTQLRVSFTAAVGKDFEIVKSEFKQLSNARGGGSYLLMHVRAKHSGYYTLTYRYKYNDPHYSHVERDFSLRVGAKGCRRGPPNLGSYSRYCVGDTIIIPIALNNFSEHQFKLSSQPYTKEDETSFAEQYPGSDEMVLEFGQVLNPVSDQLLYLGIGDRKMLHRNGGYTLESYAVFLALRPGRFNLALSVPIPERRTSLPLGESTSAHVPVIIVARDTPVTLLASRQEVRGYTRGYDGSEYVSSTSGDAFMSELIILQPGDRILLTYHTSVRSRDDERSEQQTLEGVWFSPQISPQITKLPFALNLEYDFTEWLVDYLPR